MGDVGGGRGRTRLRRFLSGIARPYRNSHGVGRFMLISGTVLVCLMLVMAVFSPLIAPYGFSQVADATGERFGNHLEPGGDHWFGTSTQGFDVFSRVVWGARTAVTVVLLALAFSLFIGVLLGLLAGFIGRWVDRVLVMIMDSLYALPALLLAIVVAFLLAEHVGGGTATAALAITAVYIPQYFRVVRAATISAKEQTYVEAARAMGARPITIMLRYLLSNVVQSVPVIATLNAADAILTLAGLGFLGYGIQPTEASEWGYDLQRAVADAGTGIWWTGLFPGLAIVLLVMGLTLMGEGLNETMNPAIRVRRLVSITMPSIDRATARRDDAAGGTAGTTGSVDDLRKGDVR
ncbi:ABC transporter permease subunit [Phytoactinopolyspora limicola]|uniref:ABC transporter permease subunit n=1 Tax=Phytoactinopolyspora limicola TaxID=2715536 RepID=UPI00140BC837